ncbi:MAG: GNAT family N-acetyltransferase [Kangiellaceae bacterium]
MMPTIRQAKLSDALKLSNLSEKTFRDTYTKMNSQEDIDNHCDRNFSQELQADEISNTQYKVLVAEEENNLVAYALLQWSESPDCIKEKSSGEILRFYVDSSWHGKGLAQDLMAECFKQVQLNKMNIIWLGVWEDNIKAIKFYKKFNFEEVGEHVFYLGNDPQRDIILMRKL